MARKDCSTWEEMAESAEASASVVPEVDKGLLPISIAVELESKAVSDMEVMV